MNVWFSFALVLTGFLTAACIWAINLKIKRSSMITRWGSLLGIAVLLAMFFYSIDIIKGSAYSIHTIIGLSVGITIVWIVACVLTMGVLIILTVGCYWVVSTLRKTSPKQFWENLKIDFKNNFEHIKAWIEGEE